MPGLVAAWSRRLGPALLLALLALTLTAGAFVYHARTPDLAIEVIQLSRHITPDDDGNRDVMRVGFYVRFDEPEASIEVVGKKKRLIAALAPQIALRAGEHAVCHWDGRNDRGWRVAPAGYRLRVTLPGADREMVFPRRVYVETERELAVTEIDSGCEIAP